MMPDKRLLFSTSRIGANNPNFGKHHPDRASKLKAKYGDDIFKIWANKATNSGHYERTQEVKDKISIAAKGNQRWLGKHHNEDSKNKIRIAHTDTKASDETKYKMCIAHSGEKSHLWRGGISYEPYAIDFSNHLKEQIRKRDNYTCQLCGTIQNGMKLDVHHIDYNKKNSASNNLISLCHVCHIKTSHHREYWTEYFQAIIKEAGF